MVEVIQLPARPWPGDWEQRAEVDECPHDWETVSAESHPGRYVNVDRCRTCHTPRCSRLDEHRTPCVERRHHQTIHIFESGQFEPVGAYLNPEEPR